LSGKYIAQVDLAALVMPILLGWPRSMRSMPIPSHSLPTDRRPRPKNTVRLAKGTIVGANRQRQPELLESPSNTPKLYSPRGVLQGIATQQIAAGKVGDDQRITVAPVG
jgi:hypothetical protein